MDKPTYGLMGRTLSEQAQILLNALDTAETQDELSTTLDCIRRFLNFAARRGALEARQPADLAALLDRIEDYGFECEGGSLEKCVDWKRLRELATSSARAGEDGVHG